MINGWAEVQSAVSDSDENTDTSGSDEFDKKTAMNKVDAGDNSVDSGDETHASESQPILNPKSIKEIKTMVAAAKSCSKFG